MRPFLAAVVLALVSNGAAAAVGPLHSIGGTVRPVGGIELDGGATVSAAPISLVWSPRPNATQPIGFNGRMLTVTLEEWRWIGASPARADDSAPLGAHHDKERHRILDPTLLITNSPVDASFSWTPAVSSLLYVSHARNCLASPAETQVAPTSSVGLTSTTGSVPVLELSCRAAQGLTLRLGPVGGLTLRGVAANVAGTDADMGSAAFLRLRTGASSTILHGAGGATLHQNTLRIATLAVDEGQASMRFQSVRDVQLQAPAVQWEGRIRVPPFAGRLQWGDVLVQESAAQIQWNGALHLGAADAGGLALAGAVAEAPTPTTPPEPIASLGVGVLGAAALALGHLLPKPGTMTRSLLSMFSRLDPRNVLRHEGRRRLLLLIQDRPGVPSHLAARELGWSRSRLDYHLGILADQGLIQVFRMGRRAFLFPRKAWTPRDMARACLLGQPRVGPLLDRLAERPRWTQAELAAELSITQSRVSRLAARLERHGLVQRRRLRRGTEYALTTG